MERRRARKGGIERKRGEQGKVGLKRMKELEGMEG